MSCRGNIVLRLKAGLTGERAPSALRVSLIRAGLWEITAVPSALRLPAGRAALVASAP